MMNQQKIGEFLKCLRREKGLTQEQLAERFSVSSRTVSRWETGSNMPDVGMLVELADFYDVDIREIIDGERKSEMMDKETKETILKVAEYASEGEKQNQSALLYTALGVSITLCVCTLLFSGEATGLLNGIIPNDVCYYIMATVYGLAFFLFVFYIRVLPFREKPSLEQKIAVVATVVSKEVRKGTNSSGRSQMGYSFVVNFRTEDGKILELYAYEIEFGGLKEGMKGNLTYQGRYFVSFEETELNSVGSITSSGHFDRLLATDQSTEFHKPISGKERINKKKWMFLGVCALVLLLLLNSPCLMGASGKIVHVDLPFEVSTVENVEMYHFEDTPGYVEKKVIVSEEAISTLYDMFENLPLVEETAKETTGATTTSFRFNLADGTNYELIYNYHGVKKGYLISKSGNFECFTSADIGSCWSNIGLEVIRVEASELPK